MWSVAGELKDNDLFGKLEAIDVLIEYDGPRTFTLIDNDGGLCLAHWLDENGEVLRFLVVPVTPQLIEQLQRGELTLREVLDQPRVFVVDQQNSGKVQAVWSASMEGLPQDTLPVPGTMLYRSLQPILTVRTYGKTSLGREIPGSVATETINGVEKAIK